METYWRQWCAHTAGYAGSNPAVPISQSRAVKYKLFEMTMAHVCIWLSVWCSGRGTLIDLKYMGLLRGSVRIALRICYVVAE